MKSVKSKIVLIFLVLAFFSCKQENKTSDGINSHKIETNDIMDSKEFENYFLLFFSLSDENTKTDLPYVNKFMTDNKLFPFKDVCGLLNNEKVKSDERVLKFWETRCKFNKAKDKLMRKYQIDGDSIKVLMSKAIKIGKYNKKLK